MADGVNLVALYPRTAYPDRLLSWYNFTGNNNYNGTEIEGDQSLDIQNFLLQQVVANNIAVAALTLYIWEWLSTLPDEIRLYKRHKLNSRHVALFILVRYGSLPSLILPAYSVWHDFSDDFSGCLVHQQLAICIVQLIVAIIFAWRTIAIWEHQRRIIFFFVAIVCIQFGASFGLIWFSEEKILPNGSCMPVTPPNGFNPLPIFYAIAFAYDLLTFVMSIIRLWQFSNLGREQVQHPKMQWNNISSSTRVIRSKIEQTYKGMMESPLIHQLTFGGLLYFLVATAFNAVAFGLEVSKNVHSKAAITLYAPLMCILCQRIILLDVKSLWGDLDKRKDSTGSREQALMERIVNEPKLDWQGSEDSSIKSPQTDSFVEKQSQPQHVTIQVDPEFARTLGFADMIQDEPSPSSLHQASLITDSSLESSTPINAGARTSMSEEDRATALRLAGFLK